MLGRGIIKGFLETARNFFGSYYDRARLTTVQYPEVKLAPWENARTFPFLVYDGQDPIAGLRCTACTICSQECPAHCIEIVKDTVKRADYLGKMQLQPKVFNIDIAVCMGCGICAEVCPFDSIKMDQIYDLVAAVYDRRQTLDSVKTGQVLDQPGENRSLVLQLKDLAKSNDYFRLLHPTEAAAVDEARAEEQRKAQAKKAAATTQTTPATLATPATPATSAAAASIAPTTPSAT